MPGISGLAKLSANFRFTLLSLFFLLFPVIIFPLSAQPVRAATTDFYLTVLRGQATGIPNPGVIFLYPILGNPTYGSLTPLQGGEVQPGLTNYQNNGSPSNNDTFSLGDPSDTTAIYVYHVTINDPPPIALSPASLPAGQVAAGYNQNLSAINGTAPYSFQVTSGSLPAGLNLDSSGALTGTPTAGGSFNFTVTATDASSFSGSGAYTLVINPPSITVNPISLSNGQVGSNYSQTFTASGGTASYAYTISAGSLPPGLSLAPGGLLSGKPTADGSFNFTVTATDSSTGTGPYNGSRSYSLTVTPPTIGVSPASLPAAQVGVAYNQSISASSGTAPYSFTVTTGSLPAGLTLAANGQLSGMPTAGGSFDFTVTATDSSTGTGPFSQTMDYTLAVNAASITVNPASLPAARAGISYNQMISASGGTSPYTFAVTAGSLPAGLTLAANGQLSGIPTQDGPFSFTVTATDSSTGTGPYTGSKQYDFTSNTPVLTLSPGTLPGGSAGVAYNQAITAADGTSPYTLSLASGTLPPGLNLGADGSLTGTPTTAGSYNFTVSATDSTTPTPGSGSQAYTIDIVAGAPATITADPATTSQSTVVNNAFPNQLKVVVKDAYGNLVSGVEVTFTVTPVNGAGATFSGSSSVNTDSAGVATANSLTANTIAGTYSVTANLSASPLGVPANFSLTNVHDQVQKLSVTGYPSPTTAGVSHNFTVTALDTYGNTVTDYQGTVNFTTGDGIAVLPAASSLTGGVGTFSATFKTSGTQLLTASDTVTPSISGSQTGIVVEAGAAVSLTVAGYPSPTTAGVSHNFTVTALDAYGNTATGYSGSVHFSSSSPKAFLPADSTLTNGVGTFSASLNSAGTHTLSANDTANPAISGSQNVVIVLPGEATSLAITGYPAYVLVATNHNFSVTAVDDFGNTDPTYTGTVHFSSSDPVAKLPADYTFTAEDKGTHTFLAGFNTLGSQSIQVQDITNPGITGLQDAITVQKIFEPPADLAGQLRQTPDRVAANDSENLIRYTFQVKNIGQGKATMTSLKLPIDPQLVLGYTEFGDQGIWVSSVDENSVIVNLPPLSADQEISGTLVLRPKPSPAPVIGSLVTTRYSLKWTNPAGNDSQAMSNAVSFTFGGPGSNQDVSGGTVQPLTSDGPVAGSTRVVYHSNFWIPNETVSAWLTRPDGSSLPLATGKANNQGEFSVEVDTANLAPGTYVVAAYGQRSGMYGSAICQAT